MSEPISIIRAYPQDDIVGGLRNLADQIEAGEVEDVDVISTVVVCFGHARVTPLPDGELEHDIVSSYRAWRPRKDMFTIRGLLATILKR